MCESVSVQDIYQQIIVEDESECIADPPPTKQPRIDKDAASTSSRSRSTIAIETNAQACITKTPKRYALFDGLIANIVDYDADNTPIVEFEQMTDADENLPVECGICPDVMRKSKLESHLRTHLVEESNSYACIYCKETFKKYKYLAGHARRHMGIRPYVCQPCKHYYSTKEDLRMHQLRRHKSKDHVCEICGKMFTQNSMLKAHIETSHEQIRHACPHCPKSYCKKFSLRDHINAVHNSNPRMLSCPFCGMQCSDAHKMARHRKELHLNQSLYECEVCQESFKEVAYFDAHKRSIQCRTNTRRKQEEEQALLEQE